MSPFGDHPIGGPPFCVIQRGKQKSLDLAEAVVAGYGGGVIAYAEPAENIRPEYTPVIIGVHPTTIETLRTLRRARRPFVTIDNGYFKPYRQGGYFRATTNALQWIASRPGSGVGRDYDCLAEGESRFRALGLEVKPWQDGFDGHILIAQQSQTWYEMIDRSGDWNETLMLRRIASHDPKRKIIFRQKPLRGTPPQPPLIEQLEGCAGVIAYSSNVLIQAAMAGIPVCSIGYSAASPLGSATIDSLMLKTRPQRERESILYALAANQWTIEEIRSGLMWRDLQTRYEPEFLSLA